MHDIVRDSKNPTVHLDEELVHSVKIALCALNGISSQDLSRYDHDKACSVCNKVLYSSYCYYVHV